MRGFLWLRPPNPRPNEHDASVAKRNQSLRRAIVDAVPFLRVGACHRPCRRKFLCLPGWPTVRDLPGFAGSTSDLYRFCILGIASVAHVADFGPVAHEPKAWLAILL